MAEPKTVPEKAADEASSHVSPGGTYGDSGDDRAARRSQVRTTPNDGAVVADAPTIQPIE